MELEKEINPLPIESKEEDSEKPETFSPSYEVLEESFGANTYSTDCCKCNPQRC